MPATAEQTSTSLTDLVQANSLGGNTCRIAVTTNRGRGLVFIEDGGVVDATFGDLVGEDAFHALLNEPDSRTVISSGIPSPSKRIAIGWEALVASAMTRRIEGAVPVPSFANAAALDTRGNLAAGPAEAVPAPVPTPPAEPAPAVPPNAPPRVVSTGAARPPYAPRPVEPPKRPFAVTAALVALAAGGIGAFAVLGRARAGDPPPAAARPPSPLPAVSKPVEADVLLASGGQLPVLVKGAPPASPDPDSAVLPTVVLRILVGEDGSVREAIVFRSRLDLARFEDAALVAVKTYRFRPGTRVGAPVAVYMNWPVTFS